MKAIESTSKPLRSLSLALARLAPALVILLLGATAPRLAAQSDNFDLDGAIAPSTNAAPGWVPYTLGNNPDWDPPLGYYGAAIFSFPPNPAGPDGNYAYRILAPAITNDTMGQYVARAGSFRTDKTYGSQEDGSNGRFSVATDVVAWNTNSGNWTEQIFGLAWYISDTGVMSTAGYFGGWGPDLGTLGIIAVNLAAAQGNPLGAFTIIGMAAPENAIALDPTHQYRMEASSCDGSTFLLRLFDLAQPNSPWISAITYDTTFSDTPGYSGMFEANYDLPPPDILPGNSTAGADATYDNYVAYLPAPYPSTTPATMPAVVTDLSPQPGANVSAYSYPTVNVGILNRDTTVNSSTIRLYLDGAQIPYGALTIADQVYKPYNPTDNGTNFDGATVTYVMTNQFTYGSLHTNSIVFQDYPDHTWFTNTWSWTATALSPFATNGTLSVRGFSARMVHSTAAHIAANLVANGDFTANVGAFTAWPGYTGTPDSACPTDVNPASITAWTAVAGPLTSMGLNGAGAGGEVCNSNWKPVDSPFAPGSSGGYTFLFIQGGGKSLGQYLAGLAPGTTYQLSYDACSRVGNSGVWQVVVATAVGGGTTLYDSGAVAGDTSKFQHVVGSFTTPATLTGTENIELRNVSGEGDNTVDFANVTILPANYTSIPNSVASAQAVLAGQYLVDLASTNIVQTVNWGIVGNEYPGATNFPGLCVNAAAYSNSFAVEVMAYVQLAAGTNVFYVGHDNAVGIYSGTNVTDTSVVLLENNSPAYDTFNWVVIYAGLYPIHVIYEQGIGPAYLNLSTVNLTAQTTNLLNTAGSIPAFYPIPAYEPPLGPSPYPPSWTNWTVMSSSVVRSNSNYNTPVTATLQTAAWLPLPTTNAVPITANGSPCNGTGPVLNQVVTGWSWSPSGTNTITVAAPSSTKYYRLYGPGTTRILSCQKSGANLVITYRWQNP